MLTSVRKLEGELVKHRRKKQITQRPLHDKSYLDISSWNQLNQDSAVLCAATLEEYNPKDKFMLLRNPTKVYMCCLRFKAMMSFF